MVENSDISNIKLGPFSLAKVSGTICVVKTENPDDAPSPVWKIDPLDKPYLLHGLPDLRSGAGVQKRILSSHEYSLFITVRDCLRLTWFRENKIDYVKMVRENQVRSQRIALQKDLLRAARRSYRRTKSKEDKERIENAKNSLDQFIKENPENPNYAEARKKYHGYSVAARKFTNYALKVIYSQYDEADLKLARRFHGTDRMKILLVASTGIRYRQFIESFPLLGLVMVRDLYGGSHSLGSDLSVLVKGIENGVKLKKLCKSLNYPLAFRKVKPQCAHVFLANAQEMTLLHEMHPEVFKDHMPCKTMEQYRWFRLMTQMNHRVAVNNLVKLRWLRWTARVLVLPHEYEGGSVYPVKAKLEKFGRIIDLVFDAFVAAPWDHSVNWSGGWQRQNAWHQAEEARRRREREEFRQRQEAERNENIRREMEERERLRKLPFPQPWIDNCKEGPYSIRALMTQGALDAEGEAMHHCVSSYGDEVRSGNCYIYSVTDDEKRKRVATAEIRKYTDRNGNVCYNLLQLRGPCNEDPSEEVREFVSKWLVMSQPQTKLPWDEMPIDQTNPFMNEVMGQPYEELR